MDTTVKHQGARKPYQKPAVNEVKLVPEEAVLGDCKTGSGAAVLCGGELVCTGSEMAAVS